MNPRFPILSVVRLTLWKPSARHGCEAALDGWMHGVCAGFFPTQVATLWGVWWGSRA